MPKLPRFLHPSSRGLLCMRPINKWPIPATIKPPTTPRPVTTACMTTLFMKTWHEPKLTTGPSFGKMTTKSVTMTTTTHRPMTFFSMTRPSMKVKFESNWTMRPTSRIMVPQAAPKMTATTPKMTTALTSGMTNFPWLPQPWPWPWQQTLPLVPQKLPLGPWGLPLEQPLGLPLGLLRQNENSQRLKSAWV